ncbi:MAG TPA: VOC family protein [Caulobacteraceae bacterium]|jgi:catechol 2,3-dioxygenase-like lactoylglutathione lyase family enzyme
MDLGWYELSLDVKDVERSCDFYGKLGFELVGGAPEDGAATVQRGNCRIGLYQGLSPETTLLFRQGDVEAIAADLTGKGLTFERGPALDSKGVGALLRDPDGMAIYFVNLKDAERTGPASKGDRRLGWFTTSLAVADLEQSLDFYQKLGFQLVARARAGRSATLQRADCRIGLYQGYIEPDKVQVTFWQGDVVAVSRDFADKGLRFERGPNTDAESSGAILKDPDGHTIHLINMVKYRRADTETGS